MSYLLAAGPADQHWWIHLESIDVSKYWHRQVDREMVIPKQRTTFGEFHFLCLQKISMRG